MGVSEARDEARAMRAKVYTGADPVADRRRDRAIGRDAKVGIGNSAVVLNIYEAHKGRTLKTHSRNGCQSAVASDLSRRMRRA